MKVPFFGSLLFDGAGAAVVFFLGLYFVVRHDSKFGWLAIAVAAFWGWKLYALM